jgi:hypothetical protein
MYYLNRTYHALQVVVYPTTAIKSKRREQLKQLQANAAGARDA